LGVEKVDEDQFPLLFCLRYASVNRFFPACHFSPPLFFFDGFLDQHLSWSLVWLTHFSARDLDLSQHRCSFSPSIHNLISVALSAGSEFIISDRMVNAQNRFRPCRVVGTFLAKITMPGHPSLVDRQIKAFIVMRAKDVPRAVTRCGIKFRFIHCTFLPEHSQDTDSGTP